MRYGANLSWAEIGRLLDCPESSVRYHHANALLRLSRQCGDGRERRT